MKILTKTVRLTATWKRNKWKKGCSVIQACNVCKPSIDSAQLYSSFAFAFLPRQNLSVSLSDELQARRMLCILNRNRKSCCNFFASALRSHLSSRSHRTEMQISRSMSLKKPLEVVDFRPASDPPGAANNVTTVETTFRKQAIDWPHKSRRADGLTLAALSRRLTQRSTRPARCSTDNRREFQAMAPARTELFNDNTWFAPRRVVAKGGARICSLGADIPNESEERAQVTCESFFRRQCEIGGFGN